MVSNMPDHGRTHMLDHRAPEVFSGLLFAANQ
jgi:hypothetical protein